MALRPPSDPRLQFRALNNYFARARELRSGKPLAIITRPRDHLYGPKTMHVFTNLIAHDSFVRDIVLGNDTSVVLFGVLR